MFSTFIPFWVTHCANVKCVINTFWEKHTQKEKDNFQKEPKAVCTWKERKVFILKKKEDLKRKLNKEKKKILKKNITHLVR